MSEREGYLEQQTHRWLQDKADRHFDGNFGRAAAAVLEAAYAAEQDPANAWAGLEAQLQRRAR